MNDEENVNIKLGYLIKKLRKKKGISGAELAKKLNVSQQQVSRYERGATKLSFEKLIELTIYLDLDLSKLKSEIEKKEVYISMTQENYFNL
ncbi:helix-turn-helix domain-containing protein [Providencia hangzhouensis]|uniref:Helix-turn-helix transcriptional regulator n=1 Tax=Providencia rettgeri TaxID=587 RepID=A0AAE2ZC10_PRORE|nr:MULTISPECIES: helix-turn-helix transcriptional regulator [Providencia]EFE54292.1 DNA-binding helix-turn-helix protein [Providencia rettgeri DSM 1131]MBG5893045.1 helix-turn-helix transcriptional regulator [Providencia rettgeri]MBI6190428.1 helix-turn-helix transcriptional regulator [Providencia rettgeri]MBQ0531131.1 helix-turn-helix transcriptional regulator [Providencia rettgeri]MBW3117416.1 helix-turn-helix transcriptional regulator [Providencia rettgeri]